MGDQRNFSVFIIIFLIFSPHLIAAMQFGISVYQCGAEDFEGLACKLSQFLFKHNENENNQLIKAKVLQLANANSRNTF